VIARFFSNYRSLVDHDARQVSIGTWIHFLMRAIAYFRAGTLLASQWGDLTAQDEEPAKGPTYALEGTRSGLV
jgi:hypothetical protein